MPALILVTLLLVVFIFLAWFHALPGDPPTRRPRSSGPSWLGEITWTTSGCDDETATSASYRWSAADTGDATHHTDPANHGDESEHSDVTEFHVEADCSHDGDSGDSGGSCSDDSGSSGGWSSDDGDSGSSGGWFSDD